MPQVLVVEDEDSYVAALSYVLEKEGFEVVVAMSGPEGLEAFREHSPDIVLLDVMLPGLSGIEVCEAIRATSNVPVIMVSARDSEQDKVKGLELGADDYVTKPYSPRELLARIKSALRRSGVDLNADDNMLVAGPLRMDTERHEVTLAGEHVRLPKKEFALLEIFLRHPGRALSRERLIDEVWGHDYVGDTKTLDVHVKRLRAKFEADPAEPKAFLTVRGIGYRFEGYSAS